MNTYVPLISSGTAGPLGVLHLPRLWLKVSLEAAGKLAAGYPGAGKGYDQMVIDGLGLNRDALINYIKTSKPTYTEFEAWVKKNATKLDKGSIEKLNAAIRGYNHDDNTRKGILSANALPDDGRLISEAAFLFVSKQILVGIGQGLVEIGHRLELGRDRSARTLQSQVNFL
jgi:hypothetical protein